MSKLRQQLSPEILPEIVANDLCERASVKSGGVARVVGVVVAVAAVGVFLWVVLSLVLLSLMLLVLLFLFFFYFFLRVGVGFSDVVGFVGGFPSWAWAS